MAKKVLTLYIDDTSLRLMVTHGKRVKKWADLPLEPGMVRNSVVIKEAEVAEKVRQLVKTCKARAKKVVVGVSGLHCLSRPIILPQLPREMLDEAVKREARRILPVPLEQLYISWQTIPAPEGKNHVFLVAVPRNVADTVINTLHQAGLKPCLMDMKPLLLARVVPEEEAVIVDVQPNEFDIVVMSGGVPQPVRTVSLPAEASSWQDKLPLIRDDIDRTIKFYNSNNPEKLLTSSVPIFASGELAAEPEQCQSLSDELGYPVLPLPALMMKCPEGLDPNRYMANIGLALKRLESGKATGPLVTNLNALPPAYQPKPISLVRVLALPSAVVAVGLIAFLVMLIQSTSADIASMRGQLYTTTELVQQRLVQQQELAGKIAEMKSKIAEAEVSRDNLTLALADIEDQNCRVNGNLKVVMDGLPNNISLSGINQYDSIATVDGRAPSEREVLSYLGELDSSGKFAEITISRMAEVEDEGMDFTLTLISLKAQDSEVDGNLGVVISSLPRDINLGSINQDDGILTIDGWSPSEKGVLSYLGELDASGKFTEITISSMTRSEGEGMDFTLTLRVGGQG